METAKRQLESAFVTLVDGLHVAGEIIGNVRIDLDAGEALAEWTLDKSHIAAPGFRWLAALLWMFSRSYEKSGSLVNGLSVEVQGNRAEQHPLVYTRFEVCYSVRGTNIAPQAVVRAIELSTTRYCPVIRLLGKVAPVTTRHIIE